MSGEERTNSVEKNCLSPTNFPPLLNDRLLKMARGEVPDKLPVWIMRQAGRYMPEFTAFRKDHTYFEICKSPELACEVTLMPIKRYDLDAAIIFSDMLVIPQALGMTVMMEPYVGPIIPRPLSLSTLKYLIWEGAINRLEYVGQAVTLTRHKLEGKVPLFGFSGAPWTVMGYMIEGGGSKTFSKSKKWLYAQPDEAHKLLNSLTSLIIQFLVMQGKAGAQILQVFDSSAEYLNRPLYNTFCLPYLKKIREEVGKQLVDVNLYIPMALFAKGAGFCLKEQTELGYEILGIDWTMDPKHVREVVKNTNITVQGNLDPCALYAPKNELQKMTENMIKGFGHSRYIVNLGHGIYPDVDVDAVETFINTVHSTDIQ